MRKLTVAFKLNVRTDNLMLLISMFAPQPYTRADP